ncbi:MAG: hypothetical protein M1548_09130 [Actinobacteria bacterium]|nr:hypothetical protein [Actinomycetota bacterium]
MPYGMASLSEALSGVHFPISKQDLINQVGNRDVQVDERHTLKMSDFLQACVHETYNLVTDVTTCPQIEQKMKAA